MSLGSGPVKSFASASLSSFVSSGGKACQRESVCVRGGRLSQDLQVREQAHARGDCSTQTVEVDLKMCQAAQVDNALGEGSGQVGADGQPGVVSSEIAYWKNCAYRRSKLEHRPSVAGRGSVKKL